MKVVKCFMLGILIFLICTTILTASETRLMTLGYNTNFYIRDSYNIWDFPSTIVNYQNMVFAESESPVGNALWRGGIHIPISPTVVMGVYTSSEKEDLGIEETPYPDTYELDDHLSDHQYDVFLGADGVNTDFGLHLQTFSSKIEYTNPVNADSNFSEKLGWLAFACGISHKLSSKTRLDAAIHYSAGSFASIHNVRDPDQEMEPYKYSTLGIGARLFHVLSSKSFLVPFIAYQSGGEGYQWLLAEADNWWNYKAERLATSGYIVGTAIEFIPKEQNLITLVGGIQGWSYKTEVVYYPNYTSDQVLPEISSQVLPFISIGLESRIAKWLDARFSFYELLGYDKYSYPVSETQLGELKMTGSYYEANFGLAFHLGRFDIDVLVDTNYLADFLHNGPYILSGYNYEGDLFNQISLTYTFPKDEKKE